MDIQNFLSNYKNHPVMFVGAGMALRYLETSFTWDGLLKKIAYELKGNDEYYIDLKQANLDGKSVNYPRLAQQLEQEFNDILRGDRHGKFKYINDQFYELAQNDPSISRFKIYVSVLVNQCDYREDRKDEIEVFKSLKNKIASVITTNYDTLIEDLLGFSPLVGNDILLSEPYGSVYKIHGCVKHLDQIIITKDDYDKFNAKYELIRAQLLSLFIHNPIIFLGYNIGDENIKTLLKTIFSYVEPNSEMANKIRGNFILVEYSRDIESLDVVDFEIVLDGGATIRINKVKTDNYLEFYRALSDVKLQVSVMDIRKVQEVVKNIYSGEGVKVQIADSLDSLSNGDKILYVGREIQTLYENFTPKEFIRKYFQILDEENVQLIGLVDKITIPKSAYFPIFLFSRINRDLNKIKVLKSAQLEKLKDFNASISAELDCSMYPTIDSVMEDSSLAKSRRLAIINKMVSTESYSLDSLESFLRRESEAEAEQKLLPETDYKKLLLFYDHMRYEHLPNPPSFF